MKCIRKWKSKCLSLRPDTSRITLPHTHTNAYALSLTHTHAQYTNHTCFPTAYIYPNAYGHMLPNVVSTETQLKVCLNGPSAEARVEGGASNPVLMTSSIIACVSYFQRPSWEARCTLLRKSTSVICDLLPKAPILQEILVVWHQSSKILYDPRYNQQIIPISSLNMYNKQCTN